MKLNSLLRLLVAASAAWTGFAPATAETFTWNRQAYGQPYLLCPTGFGTFYTNYWPNNARWSQVLHSGSNCEGVTNSVISEPSNWSPASTNYPDGPDADVVLGAPARTLLDVTVTLNRLTVAPGGGLDIWGTAIAAKTFDFQTDGEATPIGGGWLSVVSGGALTKSGGAGLYDLGGLNVWTTNTTITVREGTLQLGWSTVLRGDVRFDVAAGSVLELQPPDPIARGYLHGDFTGTGPGTVSLGAGWMYAGGPVGTPEGGAVLDLPGELFQWTNGGIQSFSSADPLVNLGTMNIQAVANASVTNGPAFYGCSFHNRGRVNVRGAGAFTVSRSTFANETGGVVDLQGDNGFEGDNWPATVINEGTFRKSAGTGTATIDSVFSLAGGTVEVQSGHLAFQDSGTYSNGTFVIAPNSTVRLAVDGPTVSSYVDGRLTGSGGGHLILDGGGWLFAGGPHGAPSGGAVLDFPGEFFQWNRGSIQSYSSADPMVNRGTMNIQVDGNAAAGAGPAFYACWFQNESLVNLRGTGSLAVYRASLTNQAGGLIDVQGDAAIGVDALSSSGSIVNVGTIRKSAGSETTRIGSAFSLQGGTLEVRSGHVELLNGGTHTAGRFVIAAGSTVKLASDQAGLTTHLAGTLTGSGDGRLIMDQGRLATYGGGGTFDFPAGFFHWSGGMILSGSTYFTNAGTITVDGPVRLDSAVNTGRLVQTATAALSLNGIIFNRPGAEFELQGDVGLEHSGGRIENDGVIHKSGGTGTSVLDVTAINRGTVVADSGHLRFGRGLEQKAGTLTLRGDSIDIVGNLWLSGGVVTGAGSTSGNLLNAGGTVSPGDGLGILALGGTFTQWPDGVLACEVGGRNPGEFDQLAVTGAGYLGGTLRVTLVKGFTLAAGDAIPLVTYAARGSAFTQLELPPGTAIEYRADGVYLVAKESAPVTLVPPTFNDGKVTFGFSTTLGQGYSVWSKAGLGEEPWLLYTNLTGTGGPVTFVAPVGTTPQEFFRVTQP